MRRLFAVIAVNVVGVGFGFALGWALGIVTVPTSSAGFLGSDSGVIDATGVDPAEDQGDSAGAPRGHTIEGTSGDDELSPGNGPSTVLPGAGDDTVNLVNDGARDVVDCGPGEDLVVTLGGPADPLDEFDDCEQFAELTATP